VRIHWKLLYETKGRSKEDKVREMKMKVIREISGVWVPFATIGGRLLP
jgi:hypothetical protein